MKRAALMLRTLTAGALLGGACVAVSSVPAMAGSLAHAAVSATFPGPTGRIAFSDFVTSQVYAVNPDGSGLVQLTHEPSGFQAQSPVWSPDGSHIAFTRLNLSTGAGRIWIMNSDGTGQRQLAASARRYINLPGSYTPDGRHIVFARCLASDFIGCGIWIMRSDGSRRHSVVPPGTGANSSNNLSPSVSPDGRRIAFTRFDWKGIIAQVWVAGITGRHAHPLTAPRREALQPNWSPGGRRIAFASNSDRPGASVYVMRPDGGRVARLATSKWPTNSFAPSYSPGGGQIAFASDRRHPDLCCEELFVMRADGSHPHLVNTGIEGVLDVAWGTAPLVPAGSPGTLSRPPSGVPAPGVPAAGARRARCRAMPAACREASARTGAQPR